MQSWFVNGAYDDESGYEEHESIDEIQEDQKSETKKVQFADLVTVRPIPATRNGKPTPSTGTGAASAWQSERSASVHIVDRKDMNDRKGQQGRCVCGGQIVMGDGQKWAEADDDEECMSCATPIAMCRSTALGSNRSPMSWRGLPIRAGSGSARTTAI